jgi:hypothetical protein
VITLHTTRVAGVTIGNRQQLIAALRGDEQVSIVPEPDNESDKNALAVRIAGEHIGYVPRVLAEQLAPQIRGFAEGRIVELTGGVPHYPTRGVVIEIQVETGEVSA